MKILSLTIAILILSSSFSFAQNSGSDKHLVLLTIENEDDNHILTWKTSSESNTSYFIIEKSENGGAFQPAAIVDAKGHSFTETTYEYEELASDSNIRYRVKLVFMGGRMAASSIVDINSAPTTQSQMAVGQ